MRFDEDEIIALAAAIAARQEASNCSPRMYDIAKAAELLSLPKRWLYERTAKGVIPHRRLGKYIRFSDEDLRRIITMGQKGSQ